MKAEFTVLIEVAQKSGYSAFYHDISGTNGQGESIEGPRENLMEAIELILEDV